MAHFKALLDHYDPRLWPLLIAGVVYLAMNAWKKVSPASFDSMPPRLKMLPAALLGAIIGGTTGVSAILDIVVGAMSGITAVGGHEVLTRLRTGSGTREEASPPSPASEVDPTKCRTCGADLTEPPPAVPAPIVPPIPTTPPGPQPPPSPSA